MLCNTTISMTTKTPKSNFHIDITTLNKVNHALEDAHALHLLVEQKKTLTNKCKNLPTLIFKSSCIFLTLGLLLTWLIFALITAKGAMFSKRWSGDVVLEKRCYDIRKSCNTTTICTEYQTCLQDNIRFKKTWLDRYDISYGGKIENILDGTTMYNSEGGAIYSSFVVYGFITVTLFLAVLVVIYKLYYATQKTNTDQKN